MSSKLIRCAVYTRKSHEEGLDQAFNSLDAQREAGLDYIRSQIHEGWVAIETAYDDGGFTGGNMERPGLKQLLKDIDYGLVDVVVVYKVDRLSRSLSDFAAMMKVFEDRDVSFVSVTQQFNTTTSMGRLTLNMLLSFAQFEREVTGERIRDKIAATKKKGLWVGGQPPLGYRLKERKLYIHPPEAELVEKTFRGFLEADGSMLALAEKLNSEGYTTRYWVSSRGREHGGKPLTAKYLRDMLTNPLYIGRIVHKDKDWKGQHEPIVSRKLWDQVQGEIDSVIRQSQHRWSQPHLLKGKLRTHESYAMSPSSVHRPISNRAAATSGGQKRLVRYYVSQKGIQQGYKNCPIKTINASYLDELVRALVLNYLDEDVRDPLLRSDVGTRDYWIRRLIHRIVLAPDELTVKLLPDQLEAVREVEWPHTPNAEAAPCPRCLYQPRVDNYRKKVRLRIALQIKRLDGKRMLVSPDGQDLVAPGTPTPQSHIVSAIGQAYRWRELFMESGVNLPRLAKQQNVSASRIRKYLPLVQLSPTILKQALSGELPVRITLTNLLEAAQTLNWGKQAQFLGLEVAP
ncbi:recombinase family protein [Algisphaera agarilytica]|uniref:DNA invertase Pin-like site-specific DNA recombinase n=1 Tax=Algisphaera agarilytica TaxID=1385975 RepID=A0A7X0H771_9BACT|nr:recombinase family protein [Algisphaera agarilytica]MBB6429099.1 DNA invertase Pin-like site-specific DNA recombinase [Algisphaera agarilytica]